MPLQISKTPYESACPMAIVSNSAWHRREIRSGCPRDQGFFVPGIWREASGRRKLLEWGRYAVAQGHSQIPCTPHAEMEHQAIGDFRIGVLSVFAIVLSAVIGIAATIALGNNPVSPDRVPAHAAGAPDSVDDYVQGLAKLGIIKVGCFRHARQSAHPARCSQLCELHRGANPETL
jgi:hypothetical protein